VKTQSEKIMTHAKIKKPFFAALVAVSFTFAVPALAQPTDLREEAKVAYAQGRKDYDLGNFDKAIEHFKKAYEKYPDGAFLFNIAQS
jgi:outer membrane protein assembly factor BamD (BamD/ComL family)